MLLLSPFKYYECLQKTYKNSYIAEDREQVIIGIDCEFYWGDEISELRSCYEANKTDAINAPFAGLFGVLGYKCVSLFESTAPAKDAPYDFPAYAFANARAYLHYDKSSKFYTFYGDRQRYYEPLLELKDTQPAQTDATFSVLSDTQAEKAHFLAMVERAKEYIAAGDAFQIVLASQLEIESDIKTMQFYCALREANPSPYMYHFPTPFGTVVGSSPELVFSLKDSTIFVAPIAGTAPRTGDVSVDEAAKTALLSDAKELAEHRMLIDLARNDIGRVAVPASVVVKNAMHVKFYESVMHIESDVYGRLDRDKDGFLAMASIFPAGTLSGTPKIRAMQIIDELERDGRGIYGGGIGFLHFNGDVQLAILIRSAIFIPNGGKNRIFIGAGAGVVYDSIPAKEYAEINHKRASLVKVFERVARRV
ncbi:anthranilate synthase component I family protein [Campylobacter sp. 19-13652]|uniref:anthranilate synthase component I family protein n=1 Tax=Campylobacter sp. 19-13652 TaxID=2840180 RepID=UPI001C77234E|nr:anthranilate synthase component I family protein [Campylobacter sp. 19-13652]BCX78627.1 anthranilate synthase component I [Campylobacter sp. 19-13652]